MEILWGVFPLAKQWCNSAKGVCGRPGLISNESWHCLGDWRQMHLCFKNEVMDNLDWCSFFFQRCGFALSRLRENLLLSDTGTELRQRFCCMTLSELNTCWENMVKILPIENWKTGQGEGESKMLFLMQFLRLHHVPGSENPSVYLMEYKV